MKLLLDTCAFLWLAAEPEKLSQPAKDAFDDDANAFYLSDASCWEIVLKYSAGKLPLPAAPRIWIPRQVSFFQLLTLPIEREAIFTSGELPKTHLDPFDRILAAQSVAHSCAIVTPDAEISALGAQTLW